MGGDVVVVVVVEPVGVVVGVEGVVGGNVVVVETRGID